MAFQNMSKLMAVVAVSFLFLSQQSFAESYVDKASEQVRKTTSKVINSAQREIHKHSLGLGLGQTFLMGSFEEKGDDKITGDLLYAYSASYSFDLLINLHSSTHSYRDKRVWLRGLTMSIKARSYEFDAFSPFLVGGLGFYRPQIYKNDQKSVEKSTFGMNLGAGMDLRLNNRVTVGLMTQYHLPFEVKQDDMENVRGSYFKLLLTSMYLF